MVDFLFALGQALCILGLLYGAYLSITYRPEHPEENGSTADTRLDPVTPPVSYVPAETLENRLRPVREEQGITVASDQDHTGSAVRLHSRTELLIALAALVLPGGSLVLGAYWIYAWLSSRVSKPD